VWNGVPSDHCPSKGGAPEKDAVRVAEAPAQTEALPPTVAVGVS